jgi:hypothetical protein
MVVSELQLYDILKAKLGENEARQLVAFVDEKVKSEVSIQKDTLATKDDIYQLELKLQKEISAVQKSVYYVGLVQFLAIVGSVIAILSFMLRH